MIGCVVFATNFPARANHCRNQFLLLWLRDLPTAVQATCGIISNSSRLESRNPRTCCQPFTFLACHTGSLLFSRPTVMQSFSVVWLCDLNSSEFGFPRSVHQFGAYWGKVTMQKPGAIYIFDKMSQPQGLRSKHPYKSFGGLRSCRRHLRTKVDVQRRVPHVGLSWAQVGRQMPPHRSKLHMLNPTCVQTCLSRAMLDPSWAQVGAKLARVRRVRPKLGPTWLVQPT